MRQHADTGETPFRGVRVSDNSVNDGSFVCVDSLCKTYLQAPIEAIPARSNIPKLDIHQSQETK